MNINQALILSTTRALLYGTVKCKPDEIDSCWFKLSESEREYFTNIASKWLQDLKIKSPKTFEYVESNYDEIKFG